MRGQAKILLWGRMDIFWNAQYYLAHIQADYVQLMPKKALLVKSPRVNGSSKRGCAPENTYYEKIIITALTEDS